MASPKRERKRARKQELPELERRPTRGVRSRGDRKLPPASKLARAEALSEAFDMLPTPQADPEPSASHRLEDVIARHRAAVGGA